ncbi:MAG: hypothetical protein QOE35_325 [Actinomycetota bacterium]
MRVAFDVTPVLSGDTGVAEYARRLYDELKDDDGLELVPFGAGRGPDPGFPLRRIKVPLRLLHRSWRWTGRPSLRRVTGAVDLLHALEGIPPPTRAPVVLTVHDLLPVVMPELYGPRHLRTTAGHLAAARRASVLLATCHATADHVAEVTGVARERIVVAPLGHREQSPVCPPRQIAGPYILAVGAVTPRKSFHLLAQAVGRLGKASPPVVVAGPPGWDSESVHASIDAAGVRHRVTFLGRVADDELEGLYRHAELVAHPSIAEGFGIPCLEAMGYGVPVVAADIPSVREFGGDAVCLVPPGDVVALAHALADVLADAERRRAMVAAGRRRAALYTWAHTAEGVRQAYRLALQ